MMSKLGGVTNTPSQARSAEKLNDLVNAVEAVLRVKSASQVSVADLAREAGLSTAYLYTRFESKQALLDYVMERFLDEQRQAAEVIFNQGKWDQDLLGRLIWLAIQLRQSLENNLGKIRALNEVQGDSEPSAWLDLTTTGHMKDWLLACDEEITHPDPDAAVTVVLQMMTLGLQARAVLNPLHPGASVASGEVVRMVYGYLTGRFVEVKFDSPG